MHLITHSLCKHPWNNQSFSSDMDLFRTRKHFLFRAELMNSRPYSQYTIACEVDMISQSLRQKLGYHVEFKVCLVSKPLKHMVFSKFSNSKRSVFFCRIFDKFTIKQLLTLIFAWYDMNHQPCICVISLSFGFSQ